MNEPQTLLEHLVELRRRLIHAVAAVVVGTLLGTLITSRAIKILVRPVEDVDLIVLGPTEGPITYFKVTLYLGLLLALPYVLYQVYRFVAPGLYPRERRIVLLGIPTAVLLFALGGAFALGVLVPVSIPVLRSFLSDVVQHQYSLPQYLNFVTTLLLWMGVLFQTPLVLYLLTRVGLVTPQTLGQARRYVIIGAAILAAVVTPTTDPLTMLLVMGPFVVLYEAGLLLARLAMRQRRRAPKPAET
jgi:sec-independent protein translocase protein TatC